MNDVLVDTSIWIAHFRHGNAALVELLELDRIVMHPWIIGEIACGTPPNRVQTLSDLDRLRPSRRAGIAEILALIERESLSGLGCGLVDMMLLASTLLTPGTELWTLDRHLQDLSNRFGVRHRPALH